MGRRFLLLKAAWWGLLASQADLLDSVAAIRRGPLLAGAAALALVAAPAAVLLHHGETKAPATTGSCSGYATTHQSMYVEPIPLAQGSITAVTAPNYMGTVQVITTAIDQVSGTLASTTYFGEDVPGYQSSSCLIQWGRSYHGWHHDEQFETETESATLVFYH